MKSQIYSVDSYLSSRAPSHSSKEVCKTIKRTDASKSLNMRSFIGAGFALMAISTLQMAQAQHENQIDDRYASPPMMAASGGNYASGGGGYGEGGGGYGEGGGGYGGYENGGSDRPKVHLGIRLRIPAIKFELPRFTLPKITVNAKIRQPNKPRVIQLPEINLDTSSKVSKSPMMMIGGGDYGHHQGGYQQQSSHGGGAGESGYGGYSSSSHNHYQHQSYSGGSTENEFSFSTSGDDSDAGGYANNYASSGNHNANQGGGGGYGHMQHLEQHAPQQQHYGSSQQQQQQHHHTPQYNMQQYQQQQFRRPDLYDEPSDQRNGYASLPMSNQPPARVPKRVADEPVRIETGIFDPRYLLK